MGVHQLVIHCYRIAATDDRADLTALVNFALDRLAKSG
jgi:hypothetical protein